MQYWKKEKALVAYVVVKKKVVIQIESIEDILLHFTETTAG